MGNIPLRVQLQQLIYKVINPFVRLLIKLGLTPNGVTTIGFILNIGVACIFIFGAEEGQRADLSFVGWAGALVLFAGLFDMLDGQVARLGGMSSSFGALFDSVLDRYSELVTFLGICYYLVAHHYFYSSLFAFIALIGSMMVSYTRARAEGLGIECKDGLMQRPERVVTVGVTGMLCGVISHYTGDFKLYFPGTHFQLLENISIFTIPLTIMAIMTNLTAFNRLMGAKKTMEQRDAANKKSAPVKTLLTIVLVASTALLTAFHLPAKNNILNTTSIDPQDTFPIPKYNPKQLFYLQRTSNTNTIVYELNEDAKGQLIKDEPVHVYWLRYQEGGMKKELSYIQRVFAYGIKTEKTTDTSYQMHIISYKKHPLFLQKYKGDNKYHMFSNINSRMAMLRRIFIRIDPGGSLWKPNVIYVELRGTDIATGKETMERLKVS